MKKKTNKNTETNKQTRKQTIERKRDNPRKLKWLDEPQLFCMLTKLL